jgi:phosphate:Na+ symporter
MSNSIMASTSLDLGALLTGLGGGLALFLYGMRKMTESLKVAAGAGMKNLLARLTTNRFSGALAGALVTAVVQSSSVTTVMVVGFVTAGLMTFGQSMGVIMGANVGTTITAQIIAFKITEYALLMIAVGFLTELLAKTKRLQHLGTMVMGLGLLFFGMGLMSDAALPLRGHAPFIAVMQELRNPLLGILAGLAFTALVQSSSATTGIVIVLASQGLIPLEAGIALVFGANVGTCVTALLAAIGKPREAVKAAVVHVIFNLGGVLLFVAFIPQLAELIREISPQFPGLGGKDRLAAEVPRQIANAHTLFNVVNTLLFLGIADHLARWIDRIVPAPKPRPAGAGAPIYLQPMFLDQPAMALDRVEQEIGRLGQLVAGMVDRALPAALNAEDAVLVELQSRDDDVDELHGEIVAYLGRLSLQDLVENQPEQIQSCLAISNYLENIADVVESGFVASGHKRIELDVSYREDIADPLRGLHRETVALIGTALAAFLARDPVSAQRVLDSKEEFNRHTDRIRLHLARTLGGGERVALLAYRLSLDNLENLKRLHTLARRIARVVVDNKPVSVEGGDLSADAEQRSDDGQRDRWAG